MTPRQPSPPARPGCRAFSYVEMLVATAVFGLVIAAVVYANMVGMTLMDITRPKLEAELQCRRLLDQLVDDIASAKLLQLGTGDPATFVPVAADAPREGSALRLSPGLDTNSFILYFRDPADQGLKRITNGALSATLIAAGVTNDVVFTGEDLQGTVLTNSRQNMAIGINLEFSRIGPSGTPVGATSYFRAFRFRTQVARRTL
jgi:type II secretory pathway pseudopilin PulG